MSGSVLEITDSQFEQEVLSVNQDILVYFWASWCGPCRLVSPSINWAAQEYGDRLKVVKLEVDPNPEAVAQCQVEGVPALRFFRDHTVIASHEGAITKQALKDFIESQL
ncbi:thioredoxin family protein [[Synechococcus] sp. NIES-970]|uniref:thioredoxin family protein n=1 Tax=Picosynechococcus sp. NKBG15041c TaxID=1407650 RepID=UPI00041E6010|nr:thioredoxin family protein [Picosynechococcus sp. NKBG15041c]BAW96057.1 thioredoxin family protein [[Synechococcus] sp. NIES-970]